MTNRNERESDRSTTVESIGYEELCLFICKGFSGEISRITVDPNLMVGQAMPEIADSIGYVSHDWEKIGMYNLTRDFEYDMRDTFLETKTESGDLIVMADGAACHK